MPIVADNPRGGSLTVGLFSNRTINIGIGHYYNFVISKFIQIKFITNTCSKSCNNSSYFLIS